MLWKSVARDKLLVQSFAYQTDLRIVHFLCSFTFKNALALGSAKRESEVTMFAHTIECSRLAPIRSAVGWLCALAMHVHSSANVI